MSIERAGKCEGGPHDGEFRRYGADDMPVLSQGGDTEGDLLGHYLFEAGAWRWQAETPPEDGERVR